MLSKINFEKNIDGTCNLLIYYSSTSDTEFGLEFLVSENIKNNVNDVLKYIKKNSKNFKINAVKIIVNGGIIATMSLATFMNVYGADSRYSMAYLYSGTPTQQVSYISRTNGALNTVSPSYFNINADGSLSLNGISAELIDYAHSQGMKVIPFLSNHWDRAAGINALSNAENLSTEIANYINQYNLDGINIDIENVTELQKDQYTSFVTKLRSKVPITKEVSVAVAANPNGWTNGWQGSYDYTNLAANSNYLMIMTYDEHWQGSIAGPVSSISFVENSIKYALTKTTSDKIVIGLPFYGRIWNEDNSFNGNGITLDKVSSIITAYNATVTYDETSQSVKAVFTVNDTDPVSTLNGKTLTPGTYTIWYENEASIEAKMSLISKYNLKGVGAWALGQEPSTIWQNYSNWLNNTNTTDTTTQTTQSGTVIASVLNVRSTPSTTSSILTTLTKGTVVTITGSSNGWYTIKLTNGSIGYVSSSYIALNNTTTTTTIPPTPITPPITTPIITPTPITTPATTPTKTGTINTAVLNIRSSPSTKAKIIGTFRRGTVVDVIATNNDWYTIKLANGTTGYISSPFVTLKTSNTNTTASLSTTSKTGVVNTAVLNVRSSPSTNSKVLTILRRGTVINITATNNGWYTIKLANGTTGYINSSFVTLKTSTTSTTKAQSTTSKTGIVNTALLNVRSSPSTSSKVLTILRRGTSINITSSKNGWYTIKLPNGKIGYVSSALVRLK